MFRLVGYVFFLALSVSATACPAGVMRYELNTTTTNGDSAALVSGFFDTDGTLGIGIRLSGILTDYSVTITEFGRTETLLPSNSSVSETSSLFNVSSTEIVLPSGGAFFRGLFIRTDATTEGDQFVRYGALQTGNSTNVLVSIDAGTGTLALPGTASDSLIGTFSGPAVSAVPEPGSFSLFLAMGLVGFVSRRPRSRG